VAIFFFILGLPPTLKRLPHLANYINKKSILEMRNLGVCEGAVVRRYLTPLLFLKKLEK